MTKQRRTGSLIWRQSGWHARFWAVVDGEPMRVIRPLGTTLKPVAAKKLARLVAEASQGAPGLAESARAETVAEAGRRILEGRDVRDRGNDLIRFRLHVAPHIGPLLVTEVRPAHVRGALEALASLGKSRATIVHVRRVMSVVFDTLWRDELITENPVSRVRAPKGQVDTRERAVLADAELARYLAWAHPDDRHKTAVLQRQTMACVSRMFGGVRTGDLHALEWSALETEAGQFKFGWAPRKKTARPQLLEIPAMLRPILRDWWERHGRPTAGLVFPSLTGEHAGVGSKGGVSHAGAMRRDLRRAFGVDAWDGAQWQEARKLTPRECELFEGTTHVKPVDFHSWRRAFAQALADSGSTAQQAQQLTGHASLSAHQRYLVNTSRMRQLPAGALPDLTVRAWPVPQLESRFHETASFLRAPKDSNLRPSDSKSDALSS